MAKKKWSGRFQGGLDPLALDFTQSVGFDKKLYYYDMLGSLAHARGLEQAGLLSKSELKKIASALHTIVHEIDSGKIRFKEELEDVHRNIETALIKKIGKLGGKLHTGRSRNDQVALDFRLYCRARLEEMHDSLLKLERATLKKAKESVDNLMPGYTHLQRAQPIRFAHYLLAYIEMWERDRTRLLEVFRRVNVSPLGSGALAGTAFPIDRESVAGTLGFSAVSHNSLDAVSDRDFCIEIASLSSILMMHLSRLAEEWILWSTTEFHFIDLPESFCTGSSMMPQKMNPDVLELIRGKTGRVYGHLISLLTVMKALPLAYNKDLQEDKEAVFDLFETVINCVDVLTPIVEKVRPNRLRLKEAVSDSLLMATDLADWLVKRGADFRSSHEIVSQVVRYATTRGKGLDQLSLGEFRKFSRLFNGQVLRLLNAEVSTNQRTVTGGTARSSVLKEIKRLEKILKVTG
ncbi:MAG: argininosuccinate lyase [Deltaproteobacteria bacterium]|nr:argininosuccinate lyase [Deltaproteobacteria bacterium]